MKLLLALFFSVVVLQYSFAQTTDCEAPTVDPVSSCEGDAIKTMEIKEEGSDYKWYDRWGQLVSSEKTFTPDISQLEIGKVNDFIVMYDGCDDKVSFAFYSYLAKPKPPTFASGEIEYCYSYTQEEIMFRPVRIQVGTDVRWYTSEGDYTSEITGSNAKSFSYTPKLSEMPASGMYTIYATQTIDGCESEMAAKNYIRMGEIAISVDPIYSCFDTLFSTKEFTAYLSEPFDATTKVIWKYEGNIVAEGLSFTPKLNGKETSDYLNSSPVANVSLGDAYIKSYDVYFEYRNCVAKTEANLVLLPKLAPPYATIDTIINNNEEIVIPIIHSLSFGSSDVYWYTSDGELISEGKSLNFNDIPYYEKYIQTSGYNEYYIQRSESFNMGTKTITCMSQKGKFYLYFNNGYSDIKDLDTSTSIQVYIESDILKIHSSIPLKNVRVRIQTITGKKIMEINLDSDLEIDISSLTSGIYTLQLFSNNKIYQNVFIKK